MDKHKFLKNKTPVVFGIIFFVCCPVKSTAGDVQLRHLGFNFLTGGKVMFSKAFKGKTRVPFGGTFELSILPVKYFDINLRLLFTNIYYSAKEKIEFADGIKIDAGSLILEGVYIGYDHNILPGRKLNPFAEIGLNLAFHGLRGGDVDAGEWNIDMLMGGGVKFYPVKSGWLELKLEAGVSIELSTISASIGSIYVSDVFNPSHFFFLVGAGFRVL